MSPKTKAWIRAFVDYAGLIAFLITLGITRSAVWYCSPLKSSIPGLSGI